MINTFEKEFIMATPSNEISLTHAPGAARLVQRGEAAIEAVKGAVGA
ncbi:hypothetical protein [Streptomyces sp. NPDC058671]